MQYKNNGDHREIETVPLVTTSILTCKSYGSYYIGTYPET